MKHFSVGARLFYVDRRTDMTKLTVAFRNFANAPTNGMKVLVHEDACLAVHRWSKWLQQLNALKQVLWLRRRLICRSNVGTDNHKKKNLPVIHSQQYLTRNASVGPVRLMCNMFHSLNIPHTVCAASTLNN